MSTIIYIIGVESEGHSNRLKFFKGGNMSYQELIESWTNGNKTLVSKEVKNNFGFYDFATRIEDDTTLSSDDKVSILCSMLRILN